MNRANGVKTAAAIAARRRQIALWAEFVEMAINTPARNEVEAQAKLEALEALRRNAPR